jgi:integrase
MSAISRRLTARGVAGINKPGRHADGDGLYLNVSKSGSKSWVFLYQRNGKRREMGLGSIGDVPLGAARAKVAEARQALMAGGDPFARREAERVVTFGDAVDALLADVEAGWRNPKHAAQWRMTLNTYASTLRHRPVAEVGTEHVLQVLRPLWLRVPETASRTRGRIERVLDYAKALGWRSGENPARWRGHLALILPKAEKLRRGHHRALPFAELPEFMKRLRATRGLGPRALEFLILTAARSGEVRGASWGELDLDAALWTVPKGRMKAARPHRVPLSMPAMSLLEDLRNEAEALAEDGNVSPSAFLFPGTRPGRSLSDGTLERVLDRMKVAVTPHGFRSSFRDWAGDMTDHPREVVEAALAHAVGDETERAYRRSDAIEKRRGLMEAWGRYCGGETGTVVPLRRAAQSSSLGA